MVYAVLLLLLLSLVVVERGRRHSPVRLSRWPVRRMASWCRMLTLLASNVAVHPLSHSLPMEMSELLVSPGMRCAVFAWSGNWAMSSWQDSVVDVRMAPFGSPMWMDGWVVPFLWCGSVILR